MDAFLNKKYRLVKSDNFDEFMKTLGVGLVTRKMGNALSPDVELTRQGDKYVFTTYSTFKNTILAFIPGEEFDEETADGRKVKSTCTIEGNTLKQVQVQTDGKTILINREFSDTELKAVMSVDNITCTRLYQVQ